MSNIFRKNSWDDVDWDVYLKNLDTLRKRKSMSKGEFNEFLGVWNAYRRRGLNKAGRETVLTVCQKFNVTEDWLGTEHPDNTVTIHQPQPDYAPHGGYKPDFEKSMGVARDSEEWEMMGMLYEIVRYNDPDYCRAIMSNLRAFTAAIRERRRRAEIEANLESMRIETESLKMQLAELKSIVQSQARAATYFGEERRSGADRRKISGQSPTGDERRSGVERRAHRPGELNGNTI